MPQPIEMRTKSYVYGIDTLDGDDAWALFEAAAKGDVSRVNTLLDRDHRLVNAQYGYQFPLHRAVHSGMTEVVGILLARGADPGQSRYTYDSWDKLLRSAQESGFLEIESILADAMQARFNYQARFNRLKDAIISRDFASIDHVVTQEPDLLTASDALGNTALHWSVITRQMNWIRRFAELGTPIDARRADGQSPILLAASGATDYWYRVTRHRTHASIRDASVLVGFLLALGAEYSISIAAAIGDQERIIEILAADDSKARQLDSARMSPLSRASRAGYSHIVKLLLDHGANPNQPEECAPEGRALYEACCGNHLEVAQLLLERGANPNSGVDSCECCLTIGEVYHGALARPVQDLLVKFGAYMPPYRMNAEQLKEALRNRSPTVQHDEFLRCVMSNCDEELIQLLLNFEPGIIVRLEEGDEVRELRDPKLLDVLVAHGFDRTRLTWL